MITALETEETRDIVVLSAEFETVSAEFLVTLSKECEPYQSSDGEIFQPHIQRKFGDWKLTDYGQVCCGQVVSGGVVRGRNKMRAHGVTLIIGKREGIPVIDGDGCKVSFRGDVIVVGRRVTRDKMPRLAYRLAKQIARYKIPATHELQGTS